MGEEALLNPCRDLRQREPRGAKGRVPLSIQEVSLVEVFGKNVPAKEVGQAPDYCTGVWRCE